jgi:hypothetical protein
MNKLLLIIAVFTEFLFAVSPKTNEIIFKSLKIDVSQIGDEICDSIYAGLPKFETSRYRALCVAMGDVIEYNSPLDYSVVFSLDINEAAYLKVRRENQICNDVSTGAVAEGTPGTALFSEVLFAELMRLQKYGVIQNNRDSLEVFLLQEIDKMKNVSGCEDIDLVYYNEEEGAYYLIGPDMANCCSLVDSSRTSLPLLKFNSIGARATKIGENEFHLQGVKNNVTYTLFDLNGSVLEQGWVRSAIIQTPMLPAILRIQEKTIMLK